MIVHLCIRGRVFFSFVYQDVGIGPMYMHVGVGVIGGGLGPELGLYSGSPTDIVVGNVNIEP